ncbi:hypothetical protein DASC09_024180 [Saccharomycopsis crataegensis]|uniref:LrgB-like protein n=1 Tax=Saccharomycopsis crataegensis TaxID=43959 RepID=A0AAV5QJY5_9ASCO|nr:hypothetical protein DASC09_024180 [Saccharomycopsis crataegensis]
MEETSAPSIIRGSSGSLSSSDDKQNILKDLRDGVVLSFRINNRILLHNYILVPIGCVLVLCILYGVNIVIEKIKIEFPASVALMLILYVLLLLSQKIFGKFITSHIIKVIEVPANFALKWINLFFIPAFVTLPLADKITVTEAFIIAAVFVIGYLAMFVSMAYLVKSLQFLLNQTRRSSIEDAESINDEVSDGFTNEDIELTDRLRGSSLEIVNQSVDNDINSNIEEGKDLRHAKKNIFSDSNATDNRRRSSSIELPESALNLEVTDRMEAIEQEAKQEELQREKINQYIAKLPKRSRAISQRIMKYFDWGVYTTLFITGIPIYFACDYALPLHLGISIILFKIALLSPAKWKKILHPILVSFPFMLLLIYIFSLIKKQSFIDSIRAYKTGRTYLYLFTTSVTTNWPGAGDVLSAMMDISIVSLSLPMFHYRQDLKKHYIVFIPPIVICSAASFFIYPPLCHAISIAPSRSLGFVGRSVTLALGTPLIKSLGGSIPLMSVSTILSGILGVLCGDSMLKFLGIKDDDYITIGVTLGLNCGAISTAHLLINNPRAAAISSLSFSIFGTIMVIMAAITPLARVVQHWAGL